MRRLTLSLASFLLLTLAACSCTLEKRALDQLESNVKRHQADHKVLMEKVNRSADEKKDWDKHYEATFDLIRALRKSTE